MEPEESIRLLTERAQELGRLPTKSDFEPDTVNRIKSSLGSWPRALERAGLKPVSQKRLKMLAARRKKKKRRRRAARLRKE